MALKWYTRARKFPQLIGRTPDGTRIPGGPYTYTQVAAGVVTAVYASVGANPAGPVFVIEDTTRLLIESSVKEYDVVSVQKGMAVTIESDATRDAVEVVGVKTWEGLSLARQYAIIDMAFNLGAGGLRKFQRFLTAVRAGEWTRAADEIRASRYYRQLGGDPAFAENAALIVLSAAWNYPELATAIKDLTAKVAKTPQPVDQRELARTVLYGMYLMARDGAQVDEVSYRNSAGQFETVKIDREIPAALLFEAVRDQYGDSL